MKSEVLLAHEEIKNALRERMEAEWPPGTRLPPIKELARRMGVGQSSTHRAVKELVIEGVLASRPRRGTFVASASGPVAGYRICLIRSSDEPMFDAAVDSLRAALTRVGGEVRVERLVGDQQAFLDARAEADAFVLLNPYMTQPIRLPANQFLVLIDTGLDYNLGVNGAYDVVSVDSEQAGSLAGAYARRKKIASACFVGLADGDGRGAYDLTSEARLRGFCRGWGEQITSRHRLKVRAYDVIHGARAFGMYIALDPRPELIFAASDDLAMGIIHGGLAHGLQVGRDFRLIGCDGQQRGREIEGGPLTTLDVPMAGMGEAAARMLVERLQQPDLPGRRVFLSASLFAGATA